MGFSEENTFITVSSLSEYLPEDRLASIRCEKTLPSTNASLIEEVEADPCVPDGRVIIAGMQTAGRGRMGRTFVSPAGRGIYLSYLIKPGARKGESSDLTGWLDVTCKSAVAVALAINDVYSVTPQIKWVNDLYLGGRKLCGILTQSVSGMNPGEIKAVITGIGINVEGDRTSLPEELKDSATFLSAETGEHHGLPELAAAVIRRMDMLRADGTGYLEKYRELCPLPGRKLILAGKSCSSKEELAAHPELGEEVLALRVSDSFGLVVRDACGTERELTGEEILKADMAPVASGLATHDS